MARPCGHTTVLTEGNPYKQEDCRICWLYFNRPDYRQKWEGGETASSSVTFRATGPVRNTGKRDCNCGDKKKLLQEGNSNQPETPS